MKVTVSQNGLKIGKKDLPLIMGAVHYWRLERRLWPEILDKVAGMGFGMIETYVPWSVHEIARGKFDFGKSNPQNDLDAFLKLCAEKQLHVLLRPGPHINSELTFFGYPKRVLVDPDCQAVSAQGTPVILPVPPRGFPVPSYASEKFFMETSHWFDAVCPIVAKHLHPHGMVVAVQADNECSFFFRTNAYDLDYSKGAEKLYHAFLEKKYSGIDALNDAYGTRYSHFEQADMPKRFEASDREDLPRYVDWAAYKEHYLVQALARIRDMFAERGVKGIPITHNYPTPGLDSPFNVAAMEKEIDIQGFDMYPTRRDYQNLKTGCLTAAAQSRLPFIPEFGSGGWFWNLPLTHEDQRFTSLVNFMHGIKGVSYYMLVERERWYGAPIARDGRIRQPNYDFYKKLNEVVTNGQLLDLESPHKILLTKSRSYQRLESTSTLVDPTTNLFLKLVGITAAQTCSEEKFGFAEPVQIAAEKMFANWRTGLEIGKYSFAIGDTDMSLEAMSRFSLQIVPTYEFMAAEEQEKLVQYAHDGGTLFIGPHLPEIDDRMKKCVILGKALSKKASKLEGFEHAHTHKVGKGRIIVTRGLTYEEPYRTCSVEAAANLAGVSRVFLSPDREIEICYHRRKDSKDGVLFVANPTKKHIKATIIFDDGKKFMNLWSGAEICGEGCIELDTQPYSVTILEVKSK